MWRPQARPTGSSTRHRAARSSPRGVELVALPSRVKWVTVIGSPHLRRGSCDGSLLPGPSPVEARVTEARRWVSRVRTTAGRRVYCVAGADRSRGFAIRRKQRSQVDHAACGFVIRALPPVVIRFSCRPQTEAEPLDPEPQPVRAGRDKPCQAPRPTPRVGRTRSSGDVTRALYRLGPGEPPASSNSYRVSGLVAVTTAPALSWPTIHRQYRPGLRFDSVPSRHA